MNTIRTGARLTLALIPLLWLPTVLAQSTGGADLSGTWRMNAAKSKLPKTSKVQSESLVIKQDGPQIEFHYDTDGKQSHENYTADKKEKTIRAVPGAGSSIVAKAYWKGATLVTETKAVSDPSSPLGALEIMHAKNSWTLSSDGLVLTERTQWDGGQSETIYDKQ